MSQMLSIYTIIIRRFNLITEGYSIKIVASLDIDIVKISIFVITCNLVKKKKMV